MAIDAYAYRNVAAFINFSCQPNLEMKGVEGTHGDKDFKRVAFFAKKTILVGCELGYTRDVNSGDSGKNGQSLAIVTRLSAKGSSEAAVRASWE
eukprot:CAMPEP_0183361710 /NCGR_PEP_ID=MMETSP0164_2-20130417/63480_1 /TAXON_ID=221442 /ORGANISM="Coccolithus pelagicus ssp braarudi, Strain PLY182g" /LENGTH=93 /DNA_ID=CAMNT_0025536377 /DNA_START=15 /DNA_END=294 /DNA_ORIENTATION=-